MFILSEKYYISILFLLGLVTEISTGYSFTNNEKKIKYNY